MISEDFAGGSSWVHRLDPRVKILITMMLAIVTAIGKDLNMLLQVFCLSCFFLVSARLDIKEILKRLLVVNTFIAFMWLFLPFTYSGQSIFQIGPLTASYEGVMYAVKITLRSNAIMLMVISLLATSTMSALIHAMKHLYIPKKLIYLLFFLYRYIYVIRDEFYKLKEAMLLRGFKRKTSFHCYKSYAYLVGMLVIKSYERSKRVYEAMLCRGFRGKLYMMDDFKVSTADYLVFIGSLFFVSWLIMWEKGWVIL